MLYLDSHVGIFQYLCCCFNSFSPKALPNNISSHEAWFDRKPSLKHLRQFGCLAFVFDTDIPRGHKIVERSQEHCFLGYVGNKVYHLCDPINHKIVYSGDVEFKENEFLDPVIFANTPYSQITFPTPFDDLIDDETRDPSAMITYYRFKT
jgi:hypothetical protein